VAEADQPGAGGEGVSEPGFLLQQTAEVLVQRYTSQAIGQPQIIRYIAAMALAMAELEIVCEKGGPLEMGIVVRGVETLTRMAAVSIDAYRKRMTGALA